jgi:ankyrin repeat protein
VSADESNAQLGRTALVIAAARGHADCVRMLIDAGADKDAKDRVCIGPCFSKVLSYLIIIIDCSFHL